MMRTTLGVGLALALACAGNAALAQSKIELINVDPAGAGLNDPAPAAPLGGNPGRTIGEQRRIAYQYAADLWGALLSSDVDVRVRASFGPMDCRFLAGASALSIHRDFANAPLPGREYPAAMANALAGEDLSPGLDDINTTFNSELGTEACGGREWFYGLYGNGDNVAGGSNFLNVVMHEIGHGLGVAGGLSRFGEFLFGSTPAAYNEFAESNQFEATINELNLVQLETALTTVGDVVWTGARTNASTQLIADPRLLLSVAAPASVAGSYEFSIAGFGNPDAAAFPTGDVVLVRDAGTDTSRGCDGVEDEPAIANPEAIEGRIALIDRGVCEFGVKALNAQNHGAIAVIIANSEDAVFGGMSPGSVGNDVVIPVVSVSSSTGQLLRGGDAAVEVAGVVEDPDMFYGLDENGRTRLYTTTVFQGGSTLSHIDTDMSPNALMEPAETASLQSHIFIDVALDMYEDLGWPVNRDGTAILGNCDTGIPVIRDVGFIPGANLMAQQNVCEVAARGSRAGYQRCMSDHALKLRDDGYINNAEVLRVRQCVAGR